MLSWLPPQWLCGNSCIWSHDVRLHIAGTSEPKSGYGYFYYAPCFAFKHSLVHWNKKCVTVHQVPKCVNCHELIVVITWRKYCFHDCIYIMLILLLRDLSTLCVQKAIVVITGGRVHYFHDCKIGGVIIYGQNIKKILWRTTFFHQVTGYRLQQEEFFYKLRSQRIYILEWLWFTDHLGTTYGNIVLKFLYISLFKLIKRNGI